MNNPLFPRCLAVAVLLGAVVPVTAQVNAEQAADMLLASARRAYNEKNFPFAAARFKEFVEKYASHKELPSARYGLALSLVDGPERDYEKAAAQLTILAGMKDFPDLPHVYYHLGLAQRGLGNKALALAVAKPNEAATHRAQAQQRFEEAAKQYAAALAAFSARVKDADPSKPLPVDLEWAARSRCDQAEMQLRLGKAKEAATTASPFTSDKLLVKSRYHKLGLYFHGFASFLGKDYLIAGRSLSKLTPFDDPIFGTHARYLLARVHHHDGERPEAATHYDAVLADHEKLKAAAVIALRNPATFKNDPEEKARLERLVKGPAPDHVGRATFFLGVMRYEDGRFPEALTRLDGFLKQFPTSPMASEAQLRIGFCQVQMKMWKEAASTLRIVAEKEPRLADQALLWAGKAQLGFADPAKPDQYDGAIKVGIALMQKGADRAAQMVDKDSEAKLRRAEIQVEIADAHQLIRQHKEAAAIYNQVLAEKQLAAREEEVTQRLATALHLAGDYAESDKVCLKFRDAFPKSALLSAVLFRHADNAYFSSLAAEKNPNAVERAKDVAKWTDEAIKRYTAVVEKYPEFAYAGLARYSLAMAHYRKGDLEKAKERFESIAQAERIGDLALVPYQLADIHIRLAPTKIENALDAGKLEEAMKAATELLEGFVNANPKLAQTPDAYLKLGHCHQRVAQVLAEKAEKTKALTSARLVYEQVMKLYPKDAAFPQAVFEWSKCLDQLGDMGGAMRNLTRFRDDATLKAAPVAPMAILHLATLMRRSNKAADAAALLGQCRQTYEAALVKDPARAGWVPLLQYHHGVALKESGKQAEARAVFELVVKSSPDRPEAGEAALRWGQSLKDDGQAKVVLARQKLANPGLKPEEITAAKKSLDEGIKEVRDSLEYLGQQAERLKEKQPTLEARARMLYEAAWGNRILAELEIETARNKIQNDLWEKRKKEVADKTPDGKKPPFVPKPEVPLASVPVQPAEKQARTMYRALIDAFPDLTVNADARFELAEILGERGEHDEAIKQLKEALDKEPPPELTDKVRVRLGACYLAKGDTKSALAQLNPVANNPKSAMNGQALYRVGECYMQNKDYVEAAKRLTPFRDQGPYQNLPGLSDRALLRLGHALEKQKQWDASRQAHEVMLQRFGNSPWAAEARYGVGWAFQNAGRYDDAVNHYNQVVNATATELGARAQLNIGLCRLAQKKYAEATTALLVVPFTYDYPHLSALALLEAARAFAENNQKEQAVKLLERVIKDHADTEHAEAAKKRLEELKKG